MTTYSFIHSIFRATRTERIKSWIRQRLIGWLNERLDTTHEPATDFQRFKQSIRAGDVVLVAGHARVSRFIHWITGSRWTHVALCLGRLNEITDPALRDQVARVCRSELEEPILIEALLGRGTVLTPLRHYHDHNLMLCRPRGLTEREVQQISKHALRHLGDGYDFRQILDLARYHSPWPLLPRRWRSTLFASRGNRPGGCICSTMLVQCFVAVEHPVMRVSICNVYAAFAASLAANPRLAIPRDFADSPYFDHFEFPITSDLQTVTSGVAEPCTLGTDLDYATRSRVRL